MMELSRRSFIKVAGGIVVGSGFVSPGCVRPWNRGTLPVYTRGVFPDMLLAPEHRDAVEHARLKLAREGSDVWLDGRSYTYEALRPIRNFYRQNCYTRHGGHAWIGWGRGDEFEPKRIRVYSCQNIPGERWENGSYSIGWSEDVGTGGNVRDFEHKTWRPRSRWQRR